MLPEPLYLTSQGHQHRAGGGAGGAGELVLKQRQRVQPGPSGQSTKGPPGPFTPSPWQLQPHVIKPQMLLQTKTAAPRGAPRQVCPGSPACPQVSLLSTDYPGLGSRSLDFQPQAPSSRLGPSLHFASWTLRGSNEARTPLWDKTPAHTPRLPGSQEAMGNWVKNPISAVPRAELRPGSAIQHLCVLT